MQRVSDFSSRLKEYRAINDLTLADLEKITHMPSQTLNRYELGQRTPKVDVANSIAESLKINSLWLQGYDVPIFSKADIEETACRPYPVIGEVAASFGSEAIEEETGDYEQKRITKTGNTTFLKTRNDDISKAEFQDAISWYMIFIVMGIFGMCHTFFIYPIQPNELMRASCVVFFLIYLAVLVVSLAALIRSLKKSYYAICDQQSKETSNQ